MQVPLAPPGLTEPVSEQTGATWEQLTNQPIIHNSIIAKLCSETSFQPNHSTSLLRSPFRFLFTFPGMIRWPTPSGGAQRHSQRLGELRSRPLPHPRGRSAAGNYAPGRLAKNLQNRWGVVHDILLQKGSPLSLSGGPPPHPVGPHSPPPEERRLSMPETGEKERNYLFKSYTDSET